MEDVCCTLHDSIKGSLLLNADQSAWSEPGSASFLEQETDLQEVSLMQLQSPCATYCHSQ